MHADQMRYVWNSGDKYEKVICGKCKKTPAVALMADCHGDEEAFCEEHWREYFADTIMAAFNPQKLDKYKFVEKDKWERDLYIDTTLARYNPK